MVDTDFESDWKVTPERLKGALEGKDRSKKWLMVLNNPGNPCEFNGRTKKKIDENVKLKRFFYL